MVNVLGHLAELHFEKYLTRKGIQFTKAGTDDYYDYEVAGKRIQIKRWDTCKTDNEMLGVNLTKTHGNRKGAGSFYERTAFDELVVYDVGFKNFEQIPINDISPNKKYPDRLPGYIKKKRSFTLDKEAYLFLNALKEKNTFFPPAIEKLRQSYNITYADLLQKISGLSLDEISSVFNDDNFRLITGAKGFSAEEHFNMLLKKSGIEYKQSDDMYDKTDHLVNSKRVQVKTPNIRATTKDMWGFKTHKIG